MLSRSWAPKPIEGSKKAREWVKGSRFRPRCLANRFLQGLRVLEEKLIAKPMLVHHEFIAIEYSLCVELSVYRRTTSCFRSAQSRRSDACYVLHKAASRSSTTRPPLVQLPQRPKLLALIVPIPSEIQS